MRRVAFIILTITAVITAFLLYDQASKSDHFISKQKHLQALQAASQKLNDLWREGFTNALWKNQQKSCFFDKIDQVKGDFFKCNPDLIQCFLKNTKKPFPTLVKAQKFNNGKFYQTENRRFNILPREIQNSILVNLQTDKFSMSVLLEDICSDMYLPQRIYASGGYKTHQDFRWDNFNQHIYVDKFLVTNSKIDQWKKREIQANFSEPSTDLTLDEMKKYCSSQGKQLMQTHIFDAAAFHPGDYNDTKPKIVFRGPYPWTTKKRSVFLYKALKDNSYEFDKKFCEFIYTQECLQKKIPYVRNKYRSWSGIFQILGGPLEAMKNTITPRNNLKASSFYFDIHSPWHKIGKRAYWDGRGFLLKNVNWRFDEPQTDPHNNYKIGFRCMRTVSI